MKRILQIALMVVIGSFPLGSNAQVIVTTAGNGTAGLTGIGGSAFTAEINAPSGVATDASGNLYFSDENNHQVKMVNSCGVISIVAGSASGASGSTGDGGAATAALLNSPAGLAFDASGNLFVCDKGNQVIRKISTTGIITTVAGTKGFNGSTGDGAAATLAKLDAPKSVAVDGSGNLYVSDQNNHRIRKVNTAGIISNFAGNSLGLNGSTGDGGAATAAKLNYPSGIALDASGNLYIADENNSEIRKVDGTGTITTVAGNLTAGFAGDGGNATAANLNFPTGVYVDAASSKLYIADQSNNKIRVVTAAGVISTVAGSSTTSGYSGDNGAPTAAVLNAPYFVSGNASGRIFFSDKNNNRVRTMFTNHAPTFINGHSQTSTTCANSVAVSINGFLAAHDTDGGQSITWTVLSAPHHGAITGTFTAVSTGCGSITPAGLAYTPTTGYSGTDSFKMSVSDGTTYDSTTIVYTITPLPNAGVILGNTTICLGTAGTLYDAVTGGTWSLSNGDVTLAPIGSDSVVLTSAVRGLDTLTYTVSGGGCNAQVSKTIVVGPYVSNIVTPNAGHFCIGNTYTMKDSVASGTWSSSDTTIAKISALGVVTPVAAGTATIAYSLVACGSLVDATQVVSVGTSPAPATITGSAIVCPASTTTLTPSVTGGSWSASNANASVAAGVVSYGVAGVDTVSYTVTTGSCSATTTLAVVTAPYAGVITGSNLSCLSNARSTTLSDVVPGGKWMSQNTAIATIDSNTGVITAVTSGSVFITYMVPFTTCGDTAYATKSINVRASPAVPSPIITTTSTICQGSSITVSDTTVGGTWSATPTSLAGLVTTGSDSAIVSGLSGGTALISYSVTANACVSSRVLTVTISPLPTVAQITGSTNACVSASRDTLFDATSGGTWSSTNTALATIGATTGIITGASAGTVTMDYSVSNSCGTTTVTKVVTVNPAPNAGTISGPSSVCVNQTITLSETVSTGSWSHLSPHCGIFPSGAVVGLSGGSDTISFYIGTAYCGTATAKFPITINPLPVKGSILGPAAICTGVTTTFADSNFTGTGVWSLLNHDTASITSTVDTFGLVTGLGVGTDTLKFVVTDLVHGCGKDSTYRVLTVSESPVAGIILGDSILCTGSNEGLRDTLSNVSTGHWNTKNTAASINAATGLLSAHHPGLDTVTYTVSTPSCGSSVVTFSVSVKQVPAATAITGPSVVCLGTIDTFKEVATGYSSIKWYSVSSSGYINLTTGAMHGLHPGTDSILCVVASQYCGSDSVYKSISINPLPNAGNISAPHSSICVGVTDTLIDASTGGVWSVKLHNTTIDTVTIPGYLAGVAKATKAGVDTVVYTVTNVCGTAVQTYALTINGLASAGKISGRVSLCQHDSVAYADTASGGLWLVTNNLAQVLNCGNVRADSVGKDTVLYVLTNICSSDTVKLPITIGMAPYAGIIRGNVGKLCKGDQISLSDSIAGGVWSHTGHVISLSSRPDTGIVRAVNAGVDTIRYRYTNSCGADTAAVVISVNPLPTAPAITTHTGSRLCLNTMYQNFGVDSIPESGYSYKWSVTNGELYATDSSHQYCLVSFNQPGYSYVKIENQNRATGCRLADSVKVYVDSTSSAPMSSVIYVSPEFFSLDNSATSYLWGYDDAKTKDSTSFPGEINQSYYNPSPDFKHYYYWVILNYGKCYQKVYFNAPTGVQEVPTSTEGVEMKLFPNPTNGSFNVEVLGGAMGMEFSVSVMDITGKELRAQMLQDGKGNVDVNGVAPGLYMVVLRSGNLKLVTKTIVKN